MKSLLAGALLALLYIAPAAAGELPAPTGPVILTLTGDIANSNGNGQAAFAMAMLEALPGRSASMETPWTNGVTRFDGPLLRAVLEAAGAKGATLKLKAINDYAADVPIEDATGIDSMLALKMDGKPMSVRDKGPVFMIRPFDTNPELYNEKYFSRSVWQIKEIEVVD
jgi:hypothetical protein